jgi:hypothetical protein
VGNVTKREFHARIVRDTFGPNLSDEDAMLLFAILHCYQVVLAGPVISDCPSAGDGSNVPAITQRHCGEVLATLWVDTGDRRADYTNWYYRWQSWGSYSRFEHLTEEERARMREMMQQMKQHPFVADFVPEDFAPAADPTKCPGRF